MVLEDGVEIAGMDGLMGDSPGSAYPLDAAEVVDAWRKSKPSIVLSAGETVEVLSDELLHAATGRRQNHRGEAFRPHESALCMNRQSL
jgi:hypothetical protein